MDGLGEMGIDLNVGSRLGDLVKAQPFVDIRVEEIKMPHGRWPEGLLRNLRRC
jgi:hypothetical protein